MGEPEKKKIVAVVGPTAGGKSALALSLARHWNGEIVSCDSMQIYRGMDVGTAKPAPEERAEIPHHMIDVREPWESFSCADYVTEARRAIGEILDRGRLPILCGGTGLYLDGVLLGGSFEETPNDPAIREKLTREAQAPGGAAALYERLCAVDPESAAATHPNNVKRVIRALEIYACCGTPKSVLDRASRQRGMMYDATVLGLGYHDRAILNERIDRRVDEMLSHGLWDEVTRLADAGVFEKNATAAQAIGYKEFLGVLRGECALADAVAELKLATRHYAKRQMTWFSAKPYVAWLWGDTEAGEIRDARDVLADAVAILNEKL